jgi:formylglycine-generating enzyme required for sulfatase activity
LANVHGGVAEMVAQCWSDTLRGLHADATRRGNGGDCRHRVVRDAASTEPAELARLSARRAIGIDERRASVGFRVVREL